MFKVLIAYYKRHTESTDKNGNSSTGFLLPIVITLGMAISTVSIVALQTVTNSSTILNNQYFDVLAREAAQAGVAAAKACIKANQKSWSNTSPLTPKTNCAGQSVKKLSNVADDSTFSSTYEVKGLQMLNASTPVITSIGSVSISTNGISFKSVSKTIRTIIRTSTTTTGRVSKNVTQVSTNGSTTCAVAEGWVYCWGSNSNKQLGQGNGAVPGNKSVFPKAIDTAHKNSASYNLLPFSGYLVNSDGTQKVVLKVSVGSTHVCAVAKDSASDATGATRKAYCWGDNSHGQLGIGNTGSTAIPRQVYNGPGQSSPSIPRSSLYNKTVTDIVAGNNFTCALTTDGLVSCWGQGNHGQLGNGFTFDKNVPVSIAYDSSSALMGRKVEKLAQIRDSDTMCAIGDNHKAYCWGDNTVGQIGNNSHALGGTTNSTVEQTIGGGQRTTACNSYPNTNNTTPTSTTGALWSVRPAAVSSALYYQSITTFKDSVTAISATNASPASRAFWWGGGTATINTKRTCTVIHCRSNGHPNQWCRVLSTDTTTTYTSNPPAGPLYGGTSLGNPYTLASGNAHDDLFCALTGGVTYCDGHSKHSSYQGIGCNQLCTTPSSPVPVFVKDSTTIGWLSGKTITDIDSAGNVTCVVADNATGCWGENTVGQLGTGNTTATNVPAPVDVTNSSDIGSTVTSETGFNYPLSF
ncbi:MAG: hypothetical protein H6797_01400 [Candidatus Nomurabacteria bacterium]|nr:MAG: hypothetical protein H6797_01400 [Candidatus Nomurabacteria bacterium]